MYYVYLLSFKGLPFYVGMSKSIAHRYFLHYRVSDTTPYYYIHSILVKHNQFVNIIPIAYCDKIKAQQIEIEYIKKFFENGVLLTNRSHNSPENRIDRYRKLRKNDKANFRFPAGFKSKLIDMENNFKLLHGGGYFKLKQFTGYSKTTRY